MDSGTNTQWEDLLGCYIFGTLCWEPSMICEWILEWLWGLCRQPSWSITYLEPPWKFSLWKQIRCHTSKKLSNSHYRQSVCVFRWRHVWCSTSQYWLDSHYRQSSHVFRWRHKGLLLILLWNSVLRSENVNWWCNQDKNTKKKYVTINKHTDIKSWELI